jgi:hypothetical protein
VKIIASVQLRIVTRGDLIEKNPSTTFHRAELRTAMIRKDSRNPVRSL